MNTFSLYKDIQARTGGEIYIGVVGPVRTGKSTFIKRFMDLLVLPNIKDEHAKQRTVDEIPQSASGRAIMTTEPKFVPKEAVEVFLDSDVSTKIRLIDCVGFLVEGATGYLEEEKERQVKTPWYEYEIPFSKAATIGTQKVIRDHSTIGVVVTTDGTIGELARENYLEAEKRTIEELQKIGKPFVVLVNSMRPYGKEAKAVAEELRKRYLVPTMAVNCEQMKEEDISEIMKNVLYEFPVAEVQFFIPKWVEMLDMEHVIKKELLEYVKEVLDKMHCIKDAKKELPKAKSQFIQKVNVESISMDCGCVKIKLDFYERFYYQVFSELIGTEIKGEYDLIHTIQKLAISQKEYNKVKDAMHSVRMKGYGVVTPSRNEITLEEPELIKQGNKYGVKLHSEAPSIHMIRANIETEIAPIVGNEEQAKDLIEYITDAKKTEEGIWNTNIFGKTVEELVMDGMEQKIRMINDESQLKLQDTMQKIVNDSNGGMVCIII